MCWGYYSEQERERESTSLHEDVCLVGDIDMKHVNKINPDSINSSRKTDKVV